MEQNLALISHGEPQWDAKVNSAINRLNEIGGGDKLSLVSHNQDGIVALNGTDLLDTYYYTVSFDGVSLVTLYYSLKNTKIEDGKLYALDLLKLPDNIKPIGSFYGVQAFGTNGSSADRILYVTLDYEGTLSVSASFTLSTDLGYRGTFVYLTSN